MKDAEALVRECRSLGVSVTLVDGQVRLRAKSRPPDDLISALREQKTDVIAFLAREQSGGSACWVLDEWRRLSIPQWRRILKLSTQREDEDRAEYARWMLSEVLQDTDFKEQEQ